jgi:5'-nucleotidase
MNTEEIDYIFADLDGVTADFDHAITNGSHDPQVFKMQPGSYVWLPPIDGALEAIRRLEEKYPGKVWFLTKPPRFSPYAYVEKALWVQRHFGDEGLHRLIVAQDKSLMGTVLSVIIDDRPHKGGVDKFRGTVIHFGSEETPNWAAVLVKLGMQ